MMEALVLLLAGAAVGFALGLRRGRRALEPPARPGPGPAEAGAGEGRADAERARAPADVLQIAAELQRMDVDRMGDPTDLLGYPRFEAGVALLVDPEVPLDRVLGYALGNNWVLGVVASEALARRPDSAPAVERVLAHIGQLAQWPLFFRLRFLAERAEVPTIGAVLTSIEAWWIDDPGTVAAIDEYVEKRVAGGEALTFGDKLSGAHADTLVDVEALLKRLDATRADPLLRELATHRASMPDLAFLESAGRLWTDGVEGPPVVRTPHVEAILGEMRAARAEAPPRSILLVGESGVGKSALRRAFSEELAAEGFRILETSGADLLSGTRYIGDIESRVDGLARNATVAKRVAIFVGQLNEMVTAGRTRERPVGVLDMIWPLIKSRQLFVVGSVSAPAYQALERAYPGLAVAVKVVRVEPADEAEAKTLAHRILGAAGPEDADDERGAVVEDAAKLAATYLGHTALPGRLLGLLELAASEARAGGAPTPTRSHLLGALGQLTGLPPDVLDEGEPLDVEELREEFRRRVIGQDEAVQCLVERVAMLKAGLTDPRRPIGVFLFAGPTGTGKTELAKALARLLFGSAEQMIRLDMSELQTPDSLSRLLGPFDGGPEPPAGSSSLAHRIRERPFSVILLDEFEKAHEKVWDLFLQVFDDGRLTDRQGNLADFRHAIIILTSNLGATIKSEAGLGFVGARHHFSTAEVMREVNRAFRKEFINRLDRVVVFQPLDREVMRAILRKELEAALSRRGFQGKEWAVEWEDSAIEFLLSKGFTHDLGARPLRRAIDRHVLAPLSVTIVEHRVPEGEQFLFVRRSGERLEVEFVDPDGERAAPPAREDGEPTPLSVPGLVRHATGSTEEVAFLAARVEAVASRLRGEGWSEAKAAGLREMNSDGFWDRDDRHEVLGRIEILDRLEAAGATVLSLAERMERGAGSGSLVRRVAEKLYVLEAGLDDLDLGRPGQALLGVRVLPEDAAHPQARSFARRVRQMYRRWSERRRMTWTQLTPSEEGPDGEAIFSVEGFGSHAILSAESGLHVFESPKDESRFDRVRVRVTVTADHLPADASLHDRLEAARSALAAPGGQPPTVVRRYREEPSPLVRDNVSGWRTGRIEAIWDGDFDVWA